MTISNSHLQQVGVFVMVTGAGLTWGWTGFMASCGLAMLLMAIAGELRG